MLQWKTAKVVCEFLKIYNYVFLIYIPETPKNIIYKNCYYVYSNISTVTSENNLRVNNKVN